MKTFVLAMATLSSLAWGALELGSLKTRNVTLAILTDGDDMTLYTYDPDLPTPGKSICNGGCAANWPPVVPQGTPVAPFSVIKRDDQSLQLAYKNQPLYTFVNDEKGKISGDGKSGVWHVVHVNP